MATRNYIVLSDGTEFTAITATVRPSGVLEVERHTSGSKNARDTYHYAPAAWFSLHVEN